MTGRRQIIVDWGTSNFRAYRFGEDGSIAEEHHAAAGILSVSDGAFEAVLEREIGPWIDASSEVLLSGMITSRNGWHETPYVEAPADLAALARNTRDLVSARGAALRFLPGVAVHDPLPDVMRGEEIQVFGSTSDEETATVILPGTHSKWVRIEQGRIAAFRTFMTGEAFAVLKENSILGRLIPHGRPPLNTQAFQAGIKQAASRTSAGLLNDLFTTRSGVLLGQFPAGEVADRLSGIIIGHELQGGIRLGWQMDTVHLVGEQGLCERYRLGLETMGLKGRIAPPHATVAGFRKLAAHKGKTS